MVAKEFVQMRRDRLTFAMMVGIPIVQLVLFGFAINSDPKSLPTAVLSNDNGVFARSVVRAMENTGYFKVVAMVDSEADIERMLKDGAVQFAVTIPPDFGRDLQRGVRPTVLVEADATDPAATSNALSALQRLPETALRHDLTGPLVRLASGPPPFRIVTHRAYNPEGITQYNIVPALIGVILTMTMIIMTALAVTREIERGTMENLLSMPIRPSEVLLGKILPYTAVGAVQVVIVLGAARVIFAVPFVGSLGLFGAIVTLFVVTNLAMGVMFSTIARNQAGDADGDILLPAVDHVVGIHVPVSWNAGLGAGHWRDPAADPFPESRAESCSRGADWPMSCPRSGRFWPSYSPF